MGRHLLFTVICDNSCRILVDVLYQDEEVSLGVITVHQWLCVCACAVTPLCPALFDSMDCMLPTRLLCPWDSPGKNTGVSCLFLLQGIFLTQGLNLHLLHCRQILNRWALMVLNMNSMSLKAKHQIYNGAMQWNTKIIWISALMKVKFMLVHGSMVLQFKNTFLPWIASPCLT